MSFLIQLGDFLRDALCLILHCLQLIKQRLRLRHVFAIIIRHFLQCNRARPRDRPSRLRLFRFGIVISSVFSM